MTDCVHFTRHRVKFSFEMRKGHRDLTKEKNGQ